MVCVLDLLLQRQRFSSSTLCSFSGIVASCGLPSLWVSGAGAGHIFSGKAGISRSRAMARGPPKPRQLFFWNCTRSRVFLPSSPLLRVWPAWLLAGSSSLSGLHLCVFSPVWVSASWRNFSVLQLEVLLFRELPGVGSWYFWQLAFCIQKYFCKTKI